MLLLLENQVKYHQLFYCNFTGYQYSFPFLSATVNLSTKDRHVEPLYKFIVHIDMPNLFFVGIPVDTAGFHVFHFQSQYILALLTGVATLPSSEQMHLELEYQKNQTLKFFRTDDVI